MLSFDECERIARKANDHTYTMGVALSPCSLPQTRRPNFEIGADEMEIGMGIHGEPGVARGKLKSADEITDEMIDRIFAEMAPSRGDRVAVLVNSLGSTPLMELYIMNRRVTAAAGRYRRRRSMRPGSATTARRSRWPARRSRFMHLDGELQTMLDHPCDCAMFRAG